MRVLHVINSLETGGAQKLLADLLPLQSRQGLDVAVLVINKKGCEFENRIAEAGIPIISLDSPSEHSPALIFKIRKHLKDYDLAHVHLFPSLYWTALASIGLKTKLIYTEHSTSNKRRGHSLFRPIEKLVYGRYAKVAAISDQTLEALLQWLRPGKRSRFTVVANGVDIEKYNKAAEKSVESIYGRSGLPVLMVSRFVPAKDQSTLIKAIQYIKNPNVFVAFAGEGSTLDVAKRLAEELGVGDRCVFLGNRDDIPELTKASAIGVQSSHWEGFGLTAVEFMAAGKPIVASSVDGLKQVVEGAGELFPAGDERMLAEKLNLLLSDADLYKATARRCLLRAKEYDISVMAQKYQELYQELFKV